MAGLKNRQWILVERPSGWPTLESFRLIEQSVPALETGQVLVRNRYLSVDPYMRPRMRNMRSYVAPLALNQVIEADTSGDVVESKNPNFKPGQLVTARMGWQDYAVVSGETLRKLPAEPEQLILSLSVLGMTGLTAYFALLDVGRPNAGETVVISAAAGAVGMMAGQIAKIKGCRAIGIVGSEAKRTFLTAECGYDSALNYNTTSNLRKDLKTLCPNGIDIYFDNVGGPISDAATTLINLRARIIICGQISLYNLEIPAQGPRNLAYLLVNRARMEGFLVHDYHDRYEEGRAQLTGWLKAGALKHRETITDGLENTPRAFLGLFRGENIGKQLVKL